jgi:hypothetical protein
VETHDRAAESATVDKVVGVAWGVYDRVFPRWDTYELTTDKTLLTLTDVDTSDYLSVIYNATSKAFTITDGATTEAGAAVRCLGSGTHALIRDTGIVRIHYDQRDFMAYGVRRAGGNTELIAWDKPNGVIAAVAAPGSFAPSNLRITFPASGVLHVPSFASGELTDAQTFGALQGIEDVLPGPPSESVVRTAGMTRYRRPDMVVDAGDRVMLTFTVDIEGVLTDAATVKLRVTRPDGTTTIYTRAGTDVSGLAPDGASVTRVSTGQYDGAFSTDPATPGDWLAKMWSEGTVTAAKELVVRVGA